jgi:SAM-dependent methyltransferase
MSDCSRLERIFVSTDYPVAINSPDHLHPCGTARDNSRNATFNAKLYCLFAHLKRPLRVLDLGCSGGGFVRDCIDDGCIAVGIEGSDYSQRMCRAEWGVLGGRFLLTSDITKDFRVTAVWDGREEPLDFDVITAWEVLEHIGKEDLPKVCENVSRHLLPSGLAIMSISSVEHMIDGVPLHQTVENKEWWVEMFSSHGLFHCPEYDAYFNGQYVRGPKQGVPGSFHVILSKDPGKRPQAPSLSLRRRLLDFWLGSKGYWLARRMVGVS